MGASDRLVVKAYIALGSNLGDRRQHLARALDMIVDRVGSSSVYETEPVGGPPGQQPYWNMVVELATARTPRELLEMCRAIEQDCGRVRAERWGPRTLDADVLLVGDLVVDEPDLVVPHPRMWERAFVLVPLAEVAPEFAPRLVGLDTSGVRKLPEPVR